MELVSLKKEGFFLGWTDRRNLREEDVLSWLSRMDEGDTGKMGSIREHVLRTMWLAV
jgi:hypothetical protein